MRPNFFHVILLQFSIISTILLSGPCVVKAANREEIPENGLRPPEGWEPTGYKATYQAGNLYEYINGGAERYLGYGIQHLTVREYSDQNTEKKVMVEIYRMDRPANAFGIYSSDRAGEHPSGIGVNCALGDYLLQFWQNVYFVRIQDLDLAGVGKARLLAFGRAISAGLPPASEADYPAILALLPAEGLLHESVCYFHTGNSLNSLVYLGEENLLSLNDSTEAVSAEYKIAGSQAVFRLVLIRYPDERSCLLNRKRLEDASLGLARSSGTELGSVSAFNSYLLATFGKIDSQTADKFQNEIRSKLNETLKE